MDQFEDLPPDLAEIDKRLRAERPVADGSTLDRVMTRARRDRTPRTSRRAVAVAMATMLAIVGSTGVAAAVMGINPIDAVTTSSSTGSAGGSSKQSEVQLDAASSQYCPPLAQLQDELARLRGRLNAELSKPPKLQDKKLIQQLQADIKRVERLIKSCYG